MSMDMERARIGESTARSPRIVEIVGPAGAGKSSLYRTLVARNDKLIADPKLRLRGVKHIPLFIRHAVRLLPVFALERGQGRRYTWEEIKKVVYLRSWHLVLTRLGERQKGIVIIDQGAVFELATLYGFGPERLRMKSFETWWEHMFQQWASSIDLLVCVDADDEILIPRIRSREDRHVVKESSDFEARKFLSDYRAAYKHVISRLEEKDVIKIVRFDTGVQSLEDVVNQVMAVLHL
jgi:hypothetical protein